MYFYIVIYKAHNAIVKMQNLAELTTLRTLNLSDNKIVQVVAVVCLPFCYECARFID